MKQLALMALNIAYAAAADNVRASGLSEEHSNPAHTELFLVWCLNMIVHLPYELRRLDLMRLGTTILSHIMLVDPSPDKPWLLRSLRASSCPHPTRTVVWSTRTLPGTVRRIGWTTTIASLPSLMMGRLGVASLPLVHESLQMLQDKDAVVHGLMGNVRAAAGHWPAAERSWARARAFDPQYEPAVTRWDAKWYASYWGAAWFPRVMENAEMVRGHIERRVASPEGRILIDNITRGRQCSTCWALDKPVLLCECRQKTYCSRRCQKLDWKTGHRLDCSHRRTQVR